MLKYIDIHSHVNFEAFDEDRDEVIKRALDSDTWVINVGTQRDTSKSAIELAHKYNEGVYATVGLHPIHTDKSFHDKQEFGDEGQGFTSRGEKFDKNIYRKFLKDPKVVAIGECGLDYYHASSSLIEKQKEAFVEQIELAEEVKKPLMIHVRNNYEDKNINAYVDTLKILKQYPKVNGVIHFFEGSFENAKDFLSLNFMISFTGVITYPPRKNGRNCNYEEIIKNTPLDMILTDTDSPYVAPVPYRGKRNEPSYVREVVKKIAEIKNLSEEKVALAVIANAKRMFRI